MSGASAYAVMPRHGLWACPMPKFDSAYEKVAGNFARQRLAWRSAPVLLGNVLIWLLSALVLLAPVIKRAAYDEPGKWNTSYEVALWLGASVMMEYSLEEAEALLSKNEKSAKRST